MLSRCRFANLVVVAALATLTAACSLEDIGSAIADDAVIDIRVVQLVPRVSSSGVSGSATIIDGSPASISVSISFARVERNDVRARYPVHIHPGLTCSGFGVPVTHDLGAPASSNRGTEGGIASVEIASTSFSIQHLSRGYSLDVHASNEPTGLPLACAVFSW
jgi:hypothetical protein